jgi:hypothetical protein
MLPLPLRIRTSEIVSGGFGEVVVLLRMKVKFEIQISCSILREGSKQHAAIPTNLQVCLFVFVLNNRFGTEVQ